ncbi:hypothetical protein [Rhodanobacter sp. FW106-PBR-R2A-1-13]|uniref:hypothetical protein n=1 Tax=Rhodanobacter sp. FW106-PBR-R2A-1-13 TaxID=3454845 RepID=UPI0034E4F4B5
MKDPDFCSRLAGLRKRRNLTVSPMSGDSAAPADGQPPVVGWHLAPYLPASVFCALAHHTQRHHEVWARCHGGYLPSGGLA